MKKIISIVLIVAGIGLAVMGFGKLDDSTASLEIGGLELSAQNNEGSSTAYIMMGLGALLLVGGVVSLSRK